MFKYPLSILIISDIILLDNKTLVVIVLDTISFVLIILFKFFKSELILLTFPFNRLVFCFKFNTFSSRELILLLIIFDSGKLTFNTHLYLIIY